jgi:GNAT superfamily N-acetyltransferase
MAVGRPAGMDSVNMEIARPDEMDAVLTLIEELLTELGQEGQEFRQVDRAKLRADLERNVASTPEEAREASSYSGRFLALLAKDRSGAAIGVLTLSTSFALYAGGEYGVIDEMYVRPESRGQGLGRGLITAALGIARERRWLRLDVTGPENAPDNRAIRFYEGMGFEYRGPKLRLPVGI